MADRYAPIPGEAEKIAAMSDKDRLAYMAKHAMDPKMLTASDRRYAKKDG